MQEFRNYAESVVRYETMPVPPTTRRIAVFAPRNNNDLATQILHDQLATALVNGSGKMGPIGAEQKYKLDAYLGGNATKTTLHGILTGATRPALLFTGSHGMRFPCGHQLQVPTQGAILCQDWPGKGTPPAPEHYFCGADLSARAKIHGMVQFLMACFGGGCPVYDNFNRASGKPAQLAPKPMLARVPQALLGSEGGALAVLAHVDRAWCSSFRMGSRPQLQGFRDVISGIMRGKRLGEATDKMNVRWSVLSTELAEILRNGAPISPEELAEKWVVRDDARNFVLFGDPAVRLRTDEMPVLN